LGGKMENVVGAGLGNRITDRKCVFDVTFKKGDL
jgi:hypothetical protein